MGIALPDLSLVTFFTSNVTKFFPYNHIYDRFNTK